jgi:VanZ family protein
VLHESWWRGLGWGLIVLVAFLSLTPNPPDTPLEQGDKIGHFMAYAALMGWWRQISVRGAALALGFVFMGVALEGLQGLTGYRQADPWDALANTVGVGIGWGLALLFPQAISSLDARIDRRLTP